MPHGCKFQDTSDQDGSRLNEQDVSVLTMMYAHAILSLPLAQDDRGAWALVRSDPRLEGENSEDVLSQCMRWTNDHAAILCCV
jgi:hypothetical protein